MRITIERLRTLVLVAGVLLLGALVTFLAIGKWKNPFNRRDIPKRLGIEIQQEGNGVTYTQAHGGHTLFKIHASKVVQYKQGTAMLHDVRIELYGEDGSRVDRIAGDEFLYDQKTGIAVASGPVEITLMRPGVAPAIAPKAAVGTAISDKHKGAPVAELAKSAEQGEIHVKTSGLTFDQKNGTATTTQHVDFSMAQGAGSSIGATYESQQGLLVLDHSVVLSTQRGAERVMLHAQHAAFDRNSMICQMRAATADYGAEGDFNASHATAGEAKILFRQDGSAVRLDATNGFLLTTAAGSRLAAPTGQMEFDEHNQPQHGHLEGGVTMDSASEASGRRRQLHGTATTAQLEFSALGKLRRAHLEQSVTMDSEEVDEQADQPLRLLRHWRSPLADVDFRDGAKGQIEPASVHGTGGVVVTAESRRGAGAVSPSRLSADDVTGTFANGSVLTSMTGVGHASMEETSETGSRQTTTGDRLEARFAAAKAGSKSGQAAASQVETALVMGHVVLTQTPAAKPNAPTPATLRATAGKADYQGQGEWLHLTLNPRVEDGALQLTADKLDVSRASGDAFAHGNVKASWTDVRNGQHSGTVALGGQGPAHVVSNEAQLHQATGEATFSGKARLWQQGNSVSAPVIVLNRESQTMTARMANAAEPVKAVLVSVGGAAVGKDSAKANQPAVIRVRGGDLRYSDVERKAVMHAGLLGNVLAETGTATSTSNEVTVVLLPTGKAANTGQAQVDHVTALGHVILTSEGRRGVGEQLVYTSATNEYVLTGTAAAPPKMTDPARGTVTGEALIFHGGDDSVTVQGGAQKTTTQTTAPR